MYNPTIKFEIYSEQLKIRFHENKWVLFVKTTFWYLLLILFPYKNDINVCKNYSNIQINMDYIDVIVVNSNY